MIPLFPKISPQVIKRISPTQNGIHIHHLSTTQSEEEIRRLCGKGEERVEDLRNQIMCQGKMNKLQILFWRNKIQK